MVNCYAPTIIQTYDTPSSAGLKWWQAPVINEDQKKHRKRGLKYLEYAENSMKNMIFAFVSP